MDTTAGPSPAEAKSSRKRLSSHLDQQADWESVKWPPKPTTADSLRKIMADLQNPTGVDATIIEDCLIRFSMLEVTG